MPIRIWSGGPKSQLVGTLSWPTDSEVAAMPEPMSDERLAEIEANADMPCFVQPCSCIGDQFRSLVAEVRRLRRALRLSQASRGVPSGVPRGVSIDAVFDAVRGDGVGRD